MKSHFSRVVALSLLVSASFQVRAQPPEPPPPPIQRDPQRSKDNADALALIGGFYNKVRHAKIYRGRLMSVDTRFKDGKIEYQFTTEIQSSWIGDAKREGSISKSFTNYVTTRLQDGETTVEKFGSLHDGSENYRFNETNKRIGSREEVGKKTIFYKLEKTWSVRDQVADTKAIPLQFTSNAWFEALTQFDGGINFKVERRTVEGQEQIVVKNAGSLAYVFDAKTGDLQSWTRTHTQGSKEYRWLNTEFDVPLEDSVFVWKAPEGAKEVAPETMRLFLPF